MRVATYIYLAIGKDDALAPLPAVGGMGRMSTADIGKVLPVFTALEIKSDTGRATPEQLAFIKCVQAAGGRAGIARSVADAEAIVFPGGEN